MSQANAHEQVDVAQHCTTTSSSTPAAMVDAPTTTPCARHSSTVSLTSSMWMTSSSVRMMTSATSVGVIDSGEEGARQVRDGVDGRRGRHGALHLHADLAGVCVCACVRRMGLCSTVLTRDVRRGSLAVVRGAFCTRRRRRSTSLIRPLGTWCIAGLSSETLSLSLPAMLRASLPLDDAV
jgi:hypothetical protein